MYICNYCKRNFKEKYEICPGCAGKSFSEKSDLGEVILRTPPEGGYTVSNKTFKTKIKHVNKVSLIILAIALIFNIFLLPFVIPFTVILIASFQEGEFTIGNEFISIFFPLLIDLIFIISAVIYNIHGKNKIKKEKEKIKYLAKNGILVKGLPYELVSDGSQIMGNPLYFYIKVTYENANGVKIPLISDIKYDAKERNNPTVDLLIDPNNYSNYYIDYEIY